MSLQTKSEHVVYRGTGDHIHMVLYEVGTGKWRHANLNVRASATAYLAQGKPAAFVIPSVSEHVVYRGTDNHIHMVLFEHSMGKWRHADLSHQAGANAFPATGDPDTFVIPNASQHVVYRGTDNHLHTVLFEYSTGKWRHADLTDRASAAGFPPAGNPNTYVIPNASQHVVYRGTDNHIHMVLYENSTGKWRHADLTDRADAAAFPAAGDPDAYVIANVSQHVVYHGTDGHIHMVLYEYSTGKWRHADLTHQAGANAFPAAGDPDTFVIPNVSQHVVYRGTDKHIHMVLYENSTGKWRHADLTDRADATAYLAAGDPAGFLFEEVVEGGSWIDDVLDGAKSAWDGFWGGLGRVWEIIGLLLTPVSFVVKIILALPVLGGLISGVINTFTHIFFGVMGFFFEGILCGIFNVCLEKRLRLCVVMFTIEREPLMTENQLEPLLQRTKQIFRDEANIKIVTSFKIYGGAGGTRAMDPPCGPQGWLEDVAGVLGIQYRTAAMVSCARWGAASIFGLGSPIYAFGVRDVKGGDDGCSLGPWSNYVVFEAQAPSKTHLAHEIGHACGLIGPWGHLDDPENLMHPKSVQPRDRLKRWQKVIVRGSKYATYW